MKHAKKVRTNQRMIFFMILPHQIENQRLYLHRIWREGSRGSAQDYGLPPNYTPRHLVSLGGSRQEDATQFLLRRVFESPTAFVLTRLCCCSSQPGADQRLPPGGPPLSLSGLRRLSGCRSGSRPDLPAALGHQRHPQAPPEAEAFAGGAAVLE